MKKLTAGLTLALLGAAGYAWAQGAGGQTVTTMNSGDTIEIQQSTGPQHQLVTALVLSNFVRTLGSTVATVPLGGTGVATGTAHGVALFEGTSAMAFTGAGATGNVFIGQGAADPLFSSSLLAPTVASSVNAVRTQGAVTGQPAIIDVSGPSVDTNAALLIEAKGSGTGAVYLAGSDINTAAAQFNTVASAVNMLTVTPGATGTGPSVGVGGASVDTNIALNVSSRGTGALNLKTGGGLQAAILDTASAVNNLTFSGSISTNVVPISAAGTGATIPIGIFPKGTSTVSLGGTTVANASLQANTVASSVDFLSVSGGATGAPGVVKAVATGTDANVTLLLGPLGTGTVKLASTGSTTPAHVETAQTTAPALTSCGTSPAITGTDTAGIVTMGTGTPTGCVITFNVAYVGTPYCVVSWIATPLASQSYVTANTAITLTQSATSSNKVQYICMATSGG